MKKGLVLITAVMSCILFSSCGSSENKQGNSTASRDDLNYAQTQAVTTEKGTSDNTQDDKQNTSANENDKRPENVKEDNSHILIAYFSRADENYNVGVIDKGNTEIIAEMIAEQTGGDLFKIETVDGYPADYDECTDVAKQEQNKNARPEMKADVSEWESYDTVFMGYPIWWGDVPMVMYTFMEGHDFSGKTVIPFCTHEGSGVSGTDITIGSVTGADTKTALAVQGKTAQNEQDKARKAVTEWLDGLEY